MPTYVLKKNLVIPAGTRFSSAPAKTERAGDGHIEAVFGLSDNTYGTVYYSLDPTSSDDLSAWFEEEKPDSLREAVPRPADVAQVQESAKDRITAAAEEATKVVEAAQSKPTTLRAFGREFTAEGFLDFTIDFAALSRICGNYAGETPEEWWRKFGASRRAVVDAVVRCISKRHGGA